MTIHLHTGVPGSCKTLHVIDSIEHLAEYKERPLYAHAVDGWSRAVQIRCKHDGCRTCRMLDPSVKKEMRCVEDWQNWAEAGALIVVDEAHYAFPQRRERECPLYITRLTEHRHDGLDFWLCTPNANLMDINVRRLVEKHTHFVNGVTGRFRISHSECMDSDERLKFGVRERFFMQPLKRSYKFYKSADMHVKIKSKIPRIMLVIPALVVVAGLAFFAAGGLSDDLRRSNQSAVDSENQGVSERVQAASDVSRASVSEFVPQPFLNSDRRVPLPVIVEGVVAACMSAKSFCTCYDDKAYKVDVRERYCELAAKGELNPRTFVQGARGWGPRDSLASAPRTP